MREITYHREVDYFIPNVYLAKDEYKNDYHIGKYGHLRLKYLKNTDTLKWVGLMNNYKHSVEEIILNEFIYI